MCGLTGLLTSGDEPEDELRRRVEGMARTLDHRGPDDGGVWSESGVALGHRRLSILDLSPAGAQPMHSGCGRFVIAFNGEVYNHLDLRRELEESRAEPAWRGHSDTETLLTGIVFWGLDETLRRAAGMFAFALWDRRERKLWLARDPMGEKPLYWGWAGRSLVFGSELKALAAHPQFAGGVDRGSLSLYLRFGYVPAPHSIHPKIYKLEPGTILEVAAAPPKEHPSEPLRPGQTHGSLAIRRYWSLNSEIEAGAANPIADGTEAVDRLEAVLRAAVQRQTISDVPIGAFLSGGVDSSTIVALMQAQSARPVKTFTIGFDEADYNEAPHAEAVAQHLGTDHVTLRITEAETRAVIPELPQIYDEPFADSSQIPTYAVCRAARTGATVALSGDAGDELFGGYNRHILGPQVWRRISWAPLMLRQLAGAAVRTVPEEAWNRIVALQGRISGSAKVALAGGKMHRLAARIQSATTLDELYRDIVSIHMDPAMLIAGRVEEPGSLLADPLPRQGVEDAAARMMVQDMRSYLPDDILCKVDRAAMAVSLETRVPFLDPEVIKLAARLPIGMKIREGRGKWVLRQVLYRHVPETLIDRPKVGFSIPLGAWLRGPLRDWAEDLLSPQGLAADGLLDPVPVRKIWAEHLSGRQDLSNQLWTILMLQAWRRRQL
ncbi:MAG: asparagine synthase (glutamine-hydrolyzing) [Natronohydrobacter sp.]|nr:asparagine synthase (glutamine-hydrolyzing) [Natronohydrobacter sp.]